MPVSKKRSVATKKQSNSKKNLVGYKRVAQPKATRGNTPASDPDSKQSDITANLRTLKTTPRFKPKRADFKLDDML